MTQINVTLFGGYMALGVTDKGVVLRYSLALTCRSLALTCRMGYLQSLIVLQLQSAKPSLSTVNLKVCNVSIKYTYHMIPRGHTPGIWLVDAPQGRGNSNVLQWLILGLGIWHNKGGVVVDLNKLSRDHRKEWRRHQETTPYTFVDQKHFYS